VKTIRPDAVFNTGGIQTFTEYKNYDGVVKLTMSNKLQLQKYASLKGLFENSEVHYLIKNGQASQAFKDFAKNLGIKMFDGNGVPIP
jgi:hypothetical protein